MKNLNKMKEDQELQECPLDVESVDSQGQLQITEDVDPMDQKLPKGDIESKKGFLKRFVANVVGGEMFSKDAFLNLFPFFLYVVLLLMLYITNIYIAEDVSKDIAKNNREAEELRVEYVYLKSEITRVTKQSNMVNMLKARGLKESVEPLRKIVVEKEGGAND